MTIHAKLDSFNYDHVKNDAESLRRSISNRLLYHVGKDPMTAADNDWYVAVARVVRDRLVDRWLDTMRLQQQNNVKRVYYLSMEFLVGRALSNGLLALNIHDEGVEAMRKMGIDLDEVCGLEPDAALGNGGLGRLAACFLDSMATLGLPSFGYGIRYDYGMFTQHIHDGYQVEQPDEWLKNGNPWEFARPEVTYPVHFGGYTDHETPPTVRWLDTEKVLAMAYDLIIPGSGTKSVSTLRLWHAQSMQVLDLTMFNQGDYMKAVETKNRSENVTRVLYPDDRSYHGRELRLRQEYFFVSASIQDIIRRHLDSHDGFREFPDKVAVHLNDTHPAIAVPELMRLLIDVHGIAWDPAWDICQHVFSYTNHTLMPEALETWPVGMLRSVLPRHMEIILEINKRFLEWVRKTRGEDIILMRRISLIDETGERRVRMAYMSVVASHKVNGVSKLHSDLLVHTIFADFANLFPDRFTNMTNGITPRRWLANANRGLAALIDSRLVPSWRTDLSKIAGLKGYATDPEFVARFRTVKLTNKGRLAAYVERELGIVVDSASLFDVQVKRMHEYKRQLLNALHIVSRYNAILADPHAGWVPRTFFFSGKSASAYRMAKLIIKFINDVARKVNADVRTNHLLKTVFVPNYGVSVAEIIIPAADLSEQISTAGTEASGTGNMKLALNGALTIGTNDGANIEIRENVGDENIFIFGLSAQEVVALRANGYDPTRHYETEPALKQVLDQMTSGFFSPEEPERYRPIVDALLRHGDHYLLLADFASYVATQARVDELYKQPDEWARKAILNVAGMGPFSSDRTIRQYAEKIWHVQPLQM